MTRPVLERVKEGKGNKKGNAIITARNNEERRGNGCSEIRKGEMALG